MPITVQLTDGRTVNFPDGTPPQEMEAALSQLPPLEQASPNRPSIADRTIGALPTIGGAVGSLAGGIGGAALGGAAGAGYRSLATHAGELPGAVADVARGLVQHPRETLGGALSGMTEGATDAGISGAIQGGLEAAGGVVGKGLKAVGGGLYRGGVALLPRSLKQASPNIATTGLKEGIALTKRGAQKAERLVSGSRQMADDVIAKAEQAGAPPVKARAVIQEFRPVRDKMRAQADLGLPNETPTLAARAKSFAGQHKGGIPLTKAQALKRESQELATNAYKARDKGAVINSMEALTNEAQARGLRKGIEARVPEVGPINQRTQDLVGVLRGAEHASETAHILPRLLGSGGAAALGSAGGLLPAVAAGGAGMALTTPGGLTATGLGIRALEPVASHAPQAGRLAALLAALGGLDE